MGVAHFQFSSHEKGGEGAEELGTCIFATICRYSTISRLTCDLFIINLQTLYFIKMRLVIYMYVNVSLE